jgi:hypothetical protein
LPPTGALDDNTVSALQAAGGAKEWIGETRGESPLSGIPEPGEGLEYDTPPMTQPISDAIDQKNWPRVLELAMQVGWFDEKRLTNLLFFSRHPELNRRPLKPQASKQDQKLALEWSQILSEEVRPAIEAAAEDLNLAVRGRFVAERDPQLSGGQGEKFKEVVAWAANEAGLDPGFLAAVLLAEVGSTAPYLGRDQVSSFLSARMISSTNGRSCKNSCRHLPKFTLVTGSRISTNTGGKSHPFFSLREGMRP